MVSLLCLFICSHFSSWAQDSLCNFRVPDRVPAVGVRVHSPSLPAAAPLSFPGSYFHPFPPQHHPQALPLLVSKFWMPCISLLPPSAFEWGRRGPLDAEIKEERSRIFKINTSFLRRQKLPSYANISCIFAYDKTVSFQDLGFTATKAIFLLQPWEVYSLGK